MTDRLKGFVVTLDNDYRTDDAEPIVNALKQIKGVLSVRPLVTDLNDHLARELVRQQLIQKLWEALK